MAVTNIQPYGKATVNSLLISSTKVHRPANSCSDCRECHIGNTALFEPGV